MYRFLLRPKWIAFHLLVISAIVLMLNLAQWQWHRHTERSAFNDTVATRSMQPPQPLAQLLASSATPGDLSFRQTTVTGTYLAAPQFEVVNRAQGGSAGRNAVAALQLADGHLLLINRGFVQSDQPIPPVPSGPQQILGRLKSSEIRSAGQGADDSSVELTEIRRIDTDTLAGQFDQPLEPLYLEVISAEPPQPADLRPIEQPQLSGGSHVSYTVQWIIFSICVAIGWVFAVRKSARSTQATQTAPAAPAAPIE